MGVEFGDNACTEVEYAIGMSHSGDSVKIVELARTHKYFCLSSTSDN